MNQGAVALTYAKIASAKATLPFAEAFFKGIQSTRVCFPLLRGRSLGPNSVRRRHRTAGYCRLLVRLMMPPPASISALIQKMTGIPKEDATEPNTSGARILIT